jgi:PAS domain-containing protein
MSNFDQLPCSVLVTDRGGFVQIVNQGLLELVGGTHDRWFAKSMDAMFPMASRIFLQTHVWPMLLRDGQVREIRLQILDGAGKQIPVFLNCSKSTTDELERFNWVFFVSIERSRFEQELLEARHRAEIASADLSKSEKFIRTVTDAMPSMLGYWDKQMLCQFANKPYLEWFGRTPQEMKGLPMAAVLGADLYEKNLPYIKAALAGAPQEFERAIQKPMVRSAIYWHITFQM